LNHTKVRKLLSAYLDGELDPSTAKLVKEHLDACKECTQELEGLRSIDVSVRSVKSELPDEGYFEFFPSRLRARLESEGTRAVPAAGVRVRLARIQMAATALVVLLAFGLGFMSGQKRESFMRAPMLRPIPLESDQVAVPSAEVEGKTGAVQAGKVAPEAKKETAVAGLAKEEPREAESIARMSVPAEAPSAGTERAETETFAGPREKDKGGARDEVAATTVYAQANVAQLQGDYESAVAEYGKVKKYSPDSDLASAAQYQINLIKTVEDTTSDLVTLRKKAKVWEEFIAQYPQSGFVQPACNQYANTLYQIAQKTNLKSDITKALGALDQCSGLTKGDDAEGYNRKAMELKESLENK
jgi:anti-sigma factor RsiW